jgi:hypothetical protein
MLATARSVVDPRSGSQVTTDDFGSRSSGSVTRWVQCATGGGARRRHTPMSVSS